MRQMGQQQHLTVVILFGLAALPAHAQSTVFGPERNIVTDPPRLQLIVQPLPALRSLTLQPQDNRSFLPREEARLDLNIQYLDGEFFNPATTKNDRVRLRSYTGTRTDTENPFVSPMLEVKPGMTIRISLNNKLPRDSSCTDWKGNVNDPHCFNGTNLHTHGLWVSPAGNGDNVLLSINPGVSFQYEYNIPADHPAGTFWYHTHRHGSTALQVSSGMAGALVIRGDRLPTPNTNGDLDTLLKSTARQPFKERVVVLQQIQYACRDAKGKIKLNPEDQTYRCDPGDVGGIEKYDQFGPRSWPDSGRYTSINGKVIPTFSGAKVGQIERWRVIHGGVRDTINLEFRKLGTSFLGQRTLSASANDAFVGTNCSGPALPQHLVAADGLTLDSVIKQTQTVFQPAYRWDLLMVFPEVGSYCVIDASIPASASVGQTPPSRRILGFVQVERGLENMETGNSFISNYLTQKLLLAADANMPANVRERVKNDLRTNLKLASFVPHPTIQDAEISGRQELVFNIDTDTSKPSPTFEVNGEPYDPTRIDRVLPLGGVEEWALKSDFASHPFHIHVNPFQIVKILDPNRRDVSGHNAPDFSGGPTDPKDPKYLIDPQYRALKGVWKDTLWVKNLVPPGSPPGQYTIFVRTRYQRYIGEFVLHCHILDHEDQGMMQNIRIALPDGRGGTSFAHH